MYKFSVAIPAYRSAETIQRTIASVVEQVVDQRDIEIVVVDDCSGDDVGAKLRPWKDRIKLYRNDRNLGLVGNWNRCISVCTGEYILLLHGDDIIAPRFLKVLGDVLDSNPVSAAVCRGEIVDEGDEQIDIQRRVFQYSGIVENAFDELLGGNKILTPCVLVRRRSYEVAGVYDERFRLYPDYDMWLRLARYEGLFFHDECLASWRCHGSNTTLSVLSEGTDIDDGVLLEAKWAPYLTSSQLKQLQRQLFADQLSASIAAFLRDDAGVAAKRLRALAKRPHPAAPLCAIAAMTTKVPGLALLGGLAVDQFRRGSWTARLRRRAR